MKKSRIFKESWMKISIWKPITTKLIINRTFFSTFVVFRLQNSQKQKFAQFLWMLNGDMLLNILIFGRFLKTVSVYFSATLPLEVLEYTVFTLYKFQVAS